MLAHMPKKMTMKPLTSLTLLLCVSMQLSGQSTFITILDSLNGNPASIQQTSDGGFAIVGSMFDAPDGNLLFIKLNSQGQLEWAETLGDSIRGISVVETQDNNFLILGETRKYGWGNFELIIIKTDNLGNVLWTKTLGGANKDTAGQMIKTADGGYAIGGFTCSFGSHGDCYLVKLDNAENTEWAKAYGDSTVGYYDRIFGLTQTDDKGFVGVGNTTNRPYAQGVIDPYIFKTDSSGNLQWAKLMSDPWVDQATSVTQMPDGGIIIAWNYIGPKVILAKLDNSGNTIWTKTYNVFNQVGLVPTISGVAMFAIDKIDFNPILVEIDTNGTVINTRSYTSPSTKSPYLSQQCFAKTNDGYIFGTTVSDTVTFNTIEFIFFKTKANGVLNCYDTTLTVADSNVVLTLDTFLTDNELSGDSMTSPTITAQPLTITDTIICLDTTGVGIFDLDLTNNFVLYPNPFQSTITIELRDKIINATGWTFQLYDIFGREVTRVEKINADRQSIQLMALPSGFYLYRIIGNNQTQTNGKIIKE